MTLPQLELFVNAADRVQNRQRAHDMEAHHLASGAAFAGGSFATAMMRRVRELVDG